MSKGIKAYIYLIVTLTMTFCISSYSQDSPHIILKRDCQVCHNPQNWKEVEFDHSQTGFLLTDRHMNVQCKDCHRLENFGDIGSDCVTCHTDIHQNKLDMRCDRCHTPQGWQVFDAEKAHQNTTFPLLGKHANLDCSTCHFSEIEGKFLPLESSCFACHQNDYRAVQSPNHQANNFSQRCEECHSFYAWQPAQLEQHDVIFPIFRGEHAGVWGRCSDCHGSVSNFQDFSCLNCHEHNQPEMDREHDDVPGYMYVSSACYSCHPSGKEEEG